jgi:hypothetical protein
MLGDSLRCAKSRSAERIETEHVLRAALADGASEGHGVLEELNEPSASVLVALDGALADSGR